LGQGPLSKDCDAWVSIPGEVGAALRVAVASPEGFGFIVETPTVAAIPSAAAAGHKPPPRFMPTSGWSHGANTALIARNATLIVFKQPPDVPATKRRTE
jgi:hypothetical protein